MSSSRDAAAAGLHKPAATTRAGFVHLETLAGRGQQPGSPHTHDTPADASRPAPAVHLLAAVTAPAPLPPPEAMAVVDFWSEAGPEMWFAKDADFDRRFRHYFLGLHEAAARGECRGWLATPHGALALVLLLDQLPRNAFRDTPRMYATDTLARQMADAAIADGHDRTVEPALQVFFYLPFGHSENLTDQQRATSLCRRLGEPHATRAQHHHDLIQRFGR
ncbi:MAG TPA: DUF924 family protein, partial [Vineibacter sp.]|nr:DUF924 family protein [Vineibacter sp.]